MDTKSLKKVFIAIAIGVATFILTMLSEMTLATDGATSILRSASMVEETPVTVIAEATVTRPDGSIATTSPGNFNIWGGTHVQVIVGGKELYCIQEGVIVWNPDRNFQISDAQKYGSIYSTAKKPWPQTHDYCRPFENNGRITFPYLWCTSHIDLTVDHPDAAYILTYPPLGTYTHDKQIALWGTDFALSQGSAAGAGGGEITEEGLRYEEYFSKMMEQEDSTVDLPTINPTDKTDLEEIELLVDYNDETLVVGPFSIDYVNGVFEGVAFGGISDMYFKGYNSSDAQIKDRIEIEKYIVGDKEYDLSFFEPNTGDSSYVDRKEQAYPKGISAGEDKFYLKIKNPNKGVTSEAACVSAIRLHIDFKWMAAYANVCLMDAKSYVITWDHEHSTHTHSSTDSEGNTTTRSCYYCTAYSWLEPLDAQNLINLLLGRRRLFTTSLEIPADDTPIGIPITMELGGIVWEDAVATKESKADGVYNTEGDIDIRMKNVKVTLYDEDGKVAELLTKEEEADSDAELMHRINPTYTDEEGKYLFRGLDIFKKYYVVFEYNGQRYLPTEYLNTAGGQYDSVEAMVNAGLYNTNEWEVTSKGTEADSGNPYEGVEISRQDFDKRFSEITAYPENYPSSNSLGVVGEYNATFTQRDLMGYTLNDDGTYSKTETQLVDGYEFDENGNETKTFSEGEISKKVREYITANKKFPDEAAMKQIYTELAGDDEDAWRKFQFIEDCQIQAYTGSPFSHERDLYPVYDQFRVNDNDLFSEEPDPWSVEYDTSTITVAGVEYKPIYPGQYYVNLGLWRRQEFDAALRKDMFKAAVKINGKTLTYDYDKRKEENEESANSADGQDNDTYWDINIRMEDYDNYYGLGYNRDIYETDYLFGTDIAPGHPGDPLEVYATYQIAVTNQSMSVMTQIRELVDYYDAEYTFKPNLSWVTFQYYRNTNKNITEKYYNMMDEPQSTIDNDGNNLALQYMAYDEEDELIAVTAENANRSSTNKTLEGFNNLYIHPIKDIKLETGETAYIYLTFQVNKDDSGKIIVDNDATPKHNIVEINGYTTFYRDGTELPNGVTKGSGDIAGILDRDSNPGNLEQEDLQGDRYEKNFEDDTDEAPPLNVTVNSEDVRRLNGNVWEDERTDETGNALIGNGLREEGEEDVEGVTVELIEKCVDGTEWNWGTVSTNAEGKYDFSSFIPGDYIVRFKYGEKDATALSTESLGRTGANIVSYNGQDFKSTSYQDGIPQEGTTDIDGNYNAYTDTANQNESGTYGYDIYKADQETDAGNNYSDAKDLWSRREAVINYSNNNVTNHVAEVLASPYQVPSYNGTAYNEDQMSALYDELISNTNMIAETGVIVMEIEYDRQTTDGDDSVENNEDTSTKDYYKDNNSQNGNYLIENVDFGLEERPKSQLEIDKSVANVRVTLANNNILFDITSEANNALWQDHKEYNIGAVKDDNNGIYPTYYDTDDKHRYSYREVIDTLVGTTDKGLIQLTMDEEIMHGATVQITYAVKVSNVGETDYIDGANKNFYYLGNTGGAHESTTTTNQLIDYVQNNLRFDASAMNNASNAVNGGSEEGTKTNTENGWAVISKDEIIGQGLVNSNLTEDVNQFIDIIQTPNFGEKALLPGESITKMLILSQEITPENTANDLTYANMVEIVKTSNEAGRRMAYSVVGNQDPTLPDASEVDANVAERIVILPPFGEQRIYYLLGIVLGTILIGGIVLIRIKVLKGKGGKGKE